jgi:hypothetical protein
MDWSTIPKPIVKPFDKIRGMDDTELQDLYSRVTAEVNAGNTMLNDLKIAIENELRTRGLIA